MEMNLLTQENLVSFLGLTFCILLLIGIVSVSNDIEKIGDEGDPKNV